MHVNENYMIVDNKSVVEKLTVNKMKNHYEIHLTYYYLK